MLKNDGVYEYIINTINNVLTNGISYYTGKDSDKIDKLMSIYDYINDDVVAIIDIEHNNVEEDNKDVINEVEDIDNSSNVDSEVSNEIEETNNVLLDDKNNDIVFEIYKLLDEFMSKITDIKIAVLNLQNDLPSYYNNNFMDKLVNKNKTIDVQNSKDINSNLDIIQEKVDNDIKDNKEETQATLIVSEENINVEENIPEEKIEDDIKEVSQKSHSILDLFKRNKEE